MTTLSEELQRVGLYKNGSFAVDEQLNAELWSGDYAELLVVDAMERGPEELNKLLDRLDNVVAKRLREARLAGRYVDAHVCILADRSSIDDSDLKSESDSSRFVSRKYWIDRSKPIDEILQRLTIAWVDILPGSSVRSIANAPVSLSNLRERLAEKKGAGAAAAFLAEIDR